MKIDHFLSLFLLSSTFWISACTNPEKEKYEAYIKEGESLAKTHCTTCHKECLPELLDKNTWAFDVLPQMGPRLGMHNFKKIRYKSIKPMLVAEEPAMEQEQWNNLVDYFYDRSPEVLPKQVFPKEPTLDCNTFEVKSFTKDISSSSIITMMEIDTVDKNIFVADINNNSLFKFGYDGNLMDSLQLPSPPTAMSIGADHFDITLAGILHPNNEFKGMIAKYSTKNQAMKMPIIIIDSLIRPVASIKYDFNYDGTDDFLVCEYGNDLGRLSLYFAKEAQYDHFIIEDIPGAIMVKINDLNKDGFMDIIALYAQGDEKIMIYYNDGEGNFKSNFYMAARFPSVYGSMYFDLHDMNNDGYMDIVYVNGDNFDYSQIFKPYHGIRILENDGYNFFDEKYFFPIYGAGKAKIHDFDLDGDPDIAISSNFADMENNPERGIIYLENVGPYDFNPYAFEASAQNQWNTMQIADLDNDGDEDILVGAMNLSNVLKDQRNDTKDEIDRNKTALLFFENKTY